MDTADAKHFLEVLKKNVSDWEDNPTWMIYSWMDYSYQWPFALKAFYRVCDPRLDKKVEMHILDEHRKTHITMFKWPVPVPMDYIGPDYPSRISPSQILVNVRGVDFIARLGTMKEIEDIVKVLQSWRK